MCGVRNDASFTQECGEGCIKALLSLPMMTGLSCFTRMPIQSGETPGLSARAPDPAVLSGIQKLQPARQLTQKPGVRSASYSTQRISKVTSSMAGRVGMEI